MQKMVGFYHDKDIEMLKIGCTLANLAYICLLNFDPFTESDNYLLEKIREEVLGGLSVVFERKTIVDETLNRKFPNICKSSLGIDASPLHPFSIC